ncbi:HD domain-containing protein [Candidatus Hecatella orcuttiae]|jgi:7,8-dihydroneopterin 2',3'-cyclic phosphate phosphodiesterase|uniref:HD domain-containing protein n=1 Tax=Candidatus Hecatella orcuttiae TaxID=1935119 RepID=UPI002867F956|nr:HD domain-containing protein [Candidatus Hecatella orcuttiae]
MNRKELKKLAAGIKDRKFRAQVESFIDKTLTQGERKGRGSLTFFTAPAGRTKHHSYPGGLAEHTVSTVKLALALADVLEECYGWKKVNRDFLIAGALIHDLYKPAVYVLREDGTYDVSPLGQRLDHLSLLLGEAYKHGFPVDFLHVLAASHGEWGPISPRTLEALLVHLADLVDSRLVGEIQKAAYFAAKDLGEQPLTLTPKEALRLLEDGEKLRRTLRKAGAGKGPSG